MTSLPVRALMFMAPVLAGGLGCPALAQAAGLTIAPVLVEIDQPRRTVSITVTNNSDAPVTLQAATRAWTQVEGRDEFDSTDEVMVVPAIASIAPRSAQVFRVALRRPAPAPFERSYRLLLEDISEAQKKGGDSAVSFRLTHSLPVMVAPSRPVLNTVQWMPCATAASEAAAGKPGSCVRLLNTGNRRIKVQTINVTGLGGQQQLPLNPAVNVLAGSAREWHLPQVPAQPGILRDVQVQLAGGAVLQAQPASEQTATGELPNPRP